MINISQMNMRTWEGISACFVPASRSGDSFEDQAEFMGESIIVGIHIAEIIAIWGWHPEHGVAWQYVAASGPDLEVPEGGQIDENYGGFTDAADLEQWLADNMGAGRHIGGNKYHDHGP